MQILNNYIIKDATEMNELYNRAIRGIISPDKFIHQISAYCPKQQNLNGKILQRLDFSVQNAECKMISAVILKQKNKDPDITILYMHGNGGSKLECLGFIPFICKNNIAVISFDFVGCGNSDHGFLTYGVNESNDAQAIIKEAEKYMKLKKLCVWGRSMGAATAILLAQRRKLMIDCLVLDSPFQSLFDVVRRIMKFETDLPKGLCLIASFILSQDINRKLNLKIFGIDYLESYRKLTKHIPTLFFYSQNDNVVPKQEVYSFYSTCKAFKQLVQIFQGHQQERSFSVFDEGVQFLKKIPEKKTNKLKLSYMTDGLQIDISSIKSKGGICCCSI